MNPAVWATAAVATLGAVTWLALLWRARAVSRSMAVATLGAALVAAGGASWAWHARAGRAADRARVTAAQVPKMGRPGGFVSSSTCASCHPSQHASWYGSYHRTMTQFPTPATVRGRFEGVGPLPIKNGHLELSRRGEEFWVTRVDGQGAGARRQELRVGLLTGSHHLQIYWLSTGPGNTQTMMPYAFLLEEERWVPARDTFLADPNLEWAFDIWNTQCLQCHVTGGQPRPTEPKPGMDSRAVELGIACESCHGPAEAHVAANASPWRRYALHLGGGADPTIVNPARLAPRAASEVCGQCHGVTAIEEYERFLQEGFSYRPGQKLGKTRPLVVPGKAESAPYIKAFTVAEKDWIESRFWSDGMVRVTGRELNALVRSPCAERGPLSCLSCHSMHGNARPDDQLTPERSGNEACLQCHADMRARVAAHTRHAEGSPGSECYNCHMPHTTYGLLKAIRSHQIDTPNVATSLATGRPNACNLCHLDRSLGWTAQHLGSWYGQPVPELPDDEQTTSSAALLALRGDAAQRALVAWSMGWEPARRAAGEEWLAAYLVLALGDSYSAVRHIAQRSLRALPGFQEIAYDYVAPPEEIEKRIQDIIVRWGQVRRPIDPAKATRLLMRPDGVLRTDLVSREISRRDERPIELRE
jgi:predicted CXXCH cytochrome family protein